VKPTHEISLAADKRLMIDERFIDPLGSSRANPGMKPQTTSFLMGVLTLGEAVGELVAL
jgi:hypothetical protein